MPTEFRRPHPRHGRSRSFSEENLSPASRDAMSLRSSLSTGVDSELYTPRSERLGPNEVLVYYDSAWSTDEVCFPPVRQRRGEHYQPNVASRPRAVSVGTPTTGKRPLVRAVGKAKGFVKIVARRSIRRLRRKSGAEGGLDESDCALSISSSAPDGWSETATTAASGISIVITSESDAEPSGGHGLLKKPSESKFSITSAECHALPYLSPNRPQSSAIVVASGPCTPRIAEMDAYRIMTVFQYGNQEEAEEEDAPDPSTERDDAPRRKPRQPKPLRPLLANIFHIVFFLPWCIAVGGAILLAPRAAGTLAFGLGFLRAAPPPGLRRAAYWAANAYEHVFVFLASVLVLAYHDAHPARRGWTLALLAARAAWAWLGFEPRPRLHERVGQDDMESLWLVWKGRAVVDGTIERHAQASAGTPVLGDEFDEPVGQRVRCGNECTCHGVCAARCPNFQRRLREFAQRA